MHSSIPKVCSIKLLIPEALPSSLTIASTQTYDLISLVGSQIILPQILSIQNNNRKQEHKYLNGKPFFIKWKNHGIDYE